ncbi:MAG: ATP-binding protein [Candidatus Thorarchaeota archaeon]
MLEKELISWKSKKEHLPLLIRGARQVGKSYLIEYFGNKYFENLVVVDFEKKEEFKLCFKNKDPKEIIKKIETLTNKKIRPKKTLLFLDEIQKCKDALVSLRYFKEEMPSLHVIAAGSLMEFLLNDENYSFPVGRIEFLYLRPLSFEEFLNAYKPMFIKKIKNFSLRSPPNEIEHKELLKLLKEYLFIGGMPSSIKTYISTNSLLESQRIHDRILKAYESDLRKYSFYKKNRYIQEVFHKLPILICEIIKYTNIDKEIRSRDLKPAIDLLTYSGIINKIFATTASGLPLHSHYKDYRFKFLFLDVGLYQTASQVDAKDFLQENILQINKGKIAEQFVGQELIAYDLPYRNKSLLFWEKTKKKGGAEIDFVTTIDSKIIPIEVKSGSTGKLKSLQSFLNLKKSSIGIRISEHRLSFNEKILSIPLYMISLLPELIKEALKTIKL